MSMGELLFEPDALCCGDTSSGKKEDNGEVFVGGMKYNDIYIRNEYSLLQSMNYWGMKSVCKVHNFRKMVDKGSESDMDDSLEDGFAVAVMKYKRAKVLKCSLSRVYQNTQFHGHLEDIQSAGGLEDLHGWWLIM